MGAGDEDFRAFRPGAIEFTSCTLTTIMGWLHLSCILLFLEHRAGGLNHLKLHLAYLYRIMGQRQQHVGLSA